MIRFAVSAWPLAVIFLAAFLILMGWPARRRKATARKRILFLAAARRRQVPPDDRGMPPLSRDDFAALAGVEQSLRRADSGPDTGAAT